MTGAELAAIRKAAGLSQRTLAKLAGIGHHAVSYWERKSEVDRRSWAVKRIGDVLAQMDTRALSRTRVGWSEWQREAEQDARQKALAAFRKREAHSATERQIRCNAKTRKGTPCRCRSEPGKARCKFHGGMSTGPKTPEGRARISEAQRARWLSYRASKNGKRK